MTASEQAENVENSSSQSSNAVFTAAADHFEAIEALAQSEDSWEKHVLRENSFEDIKSLKCLASMSVFGSLAVPSLESLSLLAITVTRNPLRLFKNDDKSLKSIYSMDVSSASSTSSTVAYKVEVCATPNRKRKVDTIGTPSKTFKALSSKMASMSLTQGVQHSLSSDDSSSGKDFSSDLTSHKDSSSDSKSIRSFTAPKPSKVNNNKCIGTSKNKKLGKTKMTQRPTTRPISQKSNKPSTQKQAILLEYFMTMNKNNIEEPASSGHSMDGCSDYVESCIVVRRKEGN